MTIGVVLAEPNGDLARMLRLLLELSGDLRVLAVADDIAVAIERGKALRPSVLVADADLMRCAGATPASLRAALPGSSLLILALYPVAVPPTGSGVRYLPKDVSPGQLAITIRALAAERPDARDAGPQVDE